MDDYPTKTFSDAEWDLIEEMAQGRIDAHAGIDQTIGGGNGLHYEMMGIATEWAVSEWLALSLEPVFADFGRGGDGKIDNMADGRSVSVKSTSYDYGWLIIPPKDVVQDITILVVGKPREQLECRGWTSRKRWMAMQKMRDFQRGVGPQPAMQQGLLRPMTEI
ncbi:MAG TPA: hypothetical protein VMX74_08265 [Pirellulales bacterium]|nr:hypothetical protein [Pirellulales bacterium]